MPRPGGARVIIYREKRGAITVLRIQGVVKLGESARQFSDYLEKVLLEDEGPVLLDFEKIDTLDSTGLGELIGYLQRFEEKNRRMAIVRPRDRIVALLKLTRLDTLIRIFPDDDAAVAYLTGGEAAR
ncbi:STAS domain-containing protein [Acidobacteria bacterium ACD]|nr:MAG: anti-sigma factor antagonist [Acidobacteriota bacterium]MCE7956682.1 anti-sigma factor antagonist [Acidobacteria bacterium ACB2]MDL1950851.1 STAS domain-containing protein [Acidobacteria bacterium ACD]